MSRRLVGFLAGNSNQAGPGPPESVFWPPGLLEQRPGSQPLFLSSILAWQ